MIKYKLHHVRALLLHKGIVEETLRKIDQNHLGAITKSLLKNRLLKSAGMISISMPEDVTFDYSMVEKGGDGIGLLMKESNICDGQHRVTGIIHAKDTNPRVGKEFDWIDANL